MTYFVKPRNKPKVVVLSPEGRSFRHFDLFEGAANPFLGELASSFWGFEFGHKYLEVEDQNCSLFIGLCGSVWVAYVTNHDVVTETYLGIIYNQLIVFVDDSDLDSLETSDGKLITMWLPQEPVEKLAWLAGADFPDSQVGLPRGVCSQILKDTKVQEIFNK